MTLAEIQHAMAAAVMMPLTSDEDMQSHAPDGRAMRDVAATFIAPNSRLTAFERLEIYNRQYWYRVLGALAEDFPALRNLLGERGFEALSVAYLTEHPSRSFTLRNLGARLPEWLCAHPQFGGKRSALAIDLARVEWAFVESFDGAEHSALEPAQIAALDGQSRLFLQPHIQLLELSYPADELAVALHKRDKRQTSEAGVKQEHLDAKPASLKGLRKRRTWVAAHRVDLSVYYRRLMPEEFRTLSALREGHPLAVALESGFAVSSMPASSRAQAVQEWFANWAELGWFCSDVPSSTK